jgi:deoxyribodipyrimidine photo-lyase
MFEGISEVQEKLKGKGIKLIVRKIAPPDGAVELSHRAAFVVFDRGYARIQKQWRKMAVDKIECPVAQVETETVVPLDAASNKDEYSAATLRGKINKLKNIFLVPFLEKDPKKSSMDLHVDSLDLKDLDGIIASMNIDKTVEASPIFRGGGDEAGKRFQDFLENKLANYEELRNEPSGDFSSGLSPYLHFGQISTVYISLKALEINPEYAEPFLEELIVRRELAANFVNFNQNYDNISCLNEWALKTLGEHSGDKREYIYSLEEFEKALTHDPYWNAAQNEMLVTGKMHGYMRMYWGKKIIEWTRSPEEAFKIALYLNNKYELDGRDPNAFAGVAWCFGKHDRPWKERPVFGKIRYMNDKGLDRKFNMKKYLAKVEKLLAKKKGAVGRPVK